MFTLNVGFLGCNGERGKEKSKVNFNFPVLQIYGRFIFSSFWGVGFCGRAGRGGTGPLRLSFTDRRNSLAGSSDTTGRAFGKPNRTLVPAPMVFRHKNPASSVSTTGQRRKVLLNERAGHPDRSMDTWVT